MKYTFLLVCILYYGTDSIAQFPIHLQTELNIQKNRTTPSKEIIDTFFSTKKEVHVFTQRIVDSFQSLGYLACYQEIVLENDTAIYSKVSTGFQYVWTKIEVENLPDSDLPLKEIDKLKSLKKKLTYQECKSILNRLLESIAAQGYPYARVFMDSTRLDQNEITSRLNIIKGPRVLLDTLEWDSDLKVNYSLMSKIIHLQTGAPYSRQSIEKIDHSLQAYPFIQQYAPPDIFVAKNLARVRLYLRTQKSSAIDALLGLLPSTEGPLKINGTFRSDFLNQLGLGERLVIDFRSLQSNSQDLNIRATAPYLFHLPFNPVIQFNLYKRDSLFLDVFGEIGASLILGDRSELRFVLGQKTSTLLKPDLDQIRSSHVLPAALDLRLRHLGAQFRIAKFDFDRNPRSGFGGQFILTGSTRSIITNASIVNLKDQTDTSFSFESLYDPYKKNGFAFELSAEFEKYTRLGNFMTLQSKLKTGIKSASTPLQINEQFRLGGFGLLRGFDEESIFSSDYYLWTNAIRLLTGELSYLQVFSDLAVVNQFADRQFKYRTFWGIGAGLAFDTSLGLLSLSVAAGKVFPNSFDLRNVKLHIGYINYF